LEIIIFVKWYVAVFLLGIVGLPITNYFFKAWPDRGYGFSKFIGLFVVAMPVWFLASLKIIPLSSSLLAILLLIGVSISLYHLNKIGFKPNKEMLISELMFFVSMYIWAIIRATNSRTEGTEKMMNIAFMSSIYRSEYFPPLDPWMSGYTINYYYLGHYLFSVIGKLAGVTVNYAYNYALITIISHVFTSLLSIFRYLFKNVKLGYALGLIGATWITFSGNLHYIVNLLISIIKFEEFSYFFPDPTRTVPMSINEFPAYSIVLGDVHGHYLGLPFLIICLAFIIASFKINIYSREKLILNFAVSFLVMALYGINSWDFITINFIIISLHLLQFYRERYDIQKMAITFMKVQLALWIPGLILIMPYMQNFEAPLVGKSNYIIDKYIGFVPAFVWDRSTCLIYDEEQKCTERAENRWQNGFLEKYLFGDPKNINGELVAPPWYVGISSRLTMWGMFIFATAGFYVLKYFSKEKFKEPIYVHFLTFTALALIIGVEFIFIKDIFHTANPANFRTNTVFKFYYQAWIIWGISSTWYVYFIYKQIKQNLNSQLIDVMIVYIMTFFLLFVGSFIYIFKAITDFYPIRELKFSNSSMDGRYYIEVFENSDYLALQWIDENIKGQPVIAEAVSNDSFQYFTRIASQSGLPTVVGWPAHQWQWRGDATIPYARKNDMDLLYQSVDVNQKLELVNKYNIEYILFGAKERETYPEVDIELFKNFADVVYQDGITTIFKVRKVNFTSNN
jgi:YYY domain-containing protein